jgi:cyclohexanone monooxygenase
VAIQTKVANEFDAIVIGAGFGGIRAIYELRQMGLSARVFEAGSDVGGTWYWNRYPGARTDSEAWSYCYFFSKELQDEWNWPERMPAQEHVSAYLRHVVERFDLRKDIVFNTRIKSAIYDVATRKWTVTSEQGAAFTCTYFITAAGLLTIPYLPPFKGIETFKGEWHLTSRWPKDKVDFAGKRIAIVGSGATAVQLLPIVAQTAAQVTLFQRTPNYVLPGRNYPLDDNQRQGLKAKKEETWALIRKQVFAFPIKPVNRMFDTVTPEERQRVLEAGWETGGFRYLFETLDDILIDERSNHAASEFIRNKIRAIVKDPVTAELLCPQYYFGLKRPPIGNFYYEAFNQDNVALADASTNPIEEITPKGIRAGGKEFEFDMLIFALGFDAMTGALTHMDIRGKNGVSIKDKWQAGPETHLGIAVDGFPNMFMISGPQTPFANVPPLIEGAVTWIGQAIRRARDGGHRSVEATPEATAAWKKQIQAMLDATLLGKGVEHHTWFLGANIPGKAHAVLFYFGGAEAYFNELQQSAERGFPGFSFARA